MCPEEIFEGKKNFQFKIFFLRQFLNLSWWFPGFWHKMSQRSPKLHSTCPDWHFAKKTFWRKRIQHLRFFREETKNFGRKVSRRKFWGNKFCKKKYFESFNDFGRESFKLFPKFPSRAVRTAFFVSKGWILGKKLELYSSLISSDTAQNILDFMRRVFGRIINYAFYSPTGSFWEKFLFEIYASHSRISSDNRRGFFAQNFPVGLSNLNPKCPDNPI